MEAVALVVLLAVLGVRLAHDQRRHVAADRAADAVAAVFTVNDWGLGVGGTAVVSLHVSGRGKLVKVDAPVLRPDAAARTEVVGAPLVVAADTGNQIRVRLQPDCGRVRALTRLDLEVAVTPASGKRHLVRVAFPQGPVLLRRACGYLPVDEALTTITYYPVRAADRFQLHLGVRNDSRDPLTLVGLDVPGLRVQTAALPVDLLPRGPTVDLALVMSVADCSRVRPGATLTGRLLDTGGEAHQVRLPIDEPNSATFRAFLTQRCR